ncbi:hypothetical protein [Methylobacterium thuringiense]|uniref:hypothetical protein n=1 Tax=Methylobacterium thuringiense TaxID=1003091 RepID=UPI001EDD0ABC|nr:hypothetical protein [Methylobacterium thuringiense]
MIEHRINNDASARNAAKIPVLHDIIALWKDAELPTLDAENRRRLVVATQILFWSGRCGEAAYDILLQENRG